MATRKKPTSQKKVKTVEDEQYSELEIYCIWLNEYYRSLLKAGFKADVALSIIMDKDSYPAWVNFKLPTDTDIKKYLDEDED